MSVGRGSVLIGLMEVEDPLLPYTLWEAQFPGLSPGLCEEESTENLIYSFSLLSTVDVTSQDVTSRRDSRCC